jgi:hypothetical protein
MAGTWVHCRDFYGEVALTFMLPTFAPLGSMLTVYVPVEGSVWVVRLKLATLDVDEVSVVPSGFNSLMVTTLIVLLVMRTVTYWLAVPANVSCPFCPGVPMVTGVAGSLMTMAPCTSAGTL